MLLNSLYIVCGLVLMPLGAEGLVRGSTGLALRMGVTALAIGLTVVAFGTSSPELVLSIEAARAGNSGIALGNVVGSNISNVALVLGLSALVRPMSVRSELVRREVPLMIGFTLLLCVLLLDGSLSRVEGLVLVVAGVFYTVFSYVAAKRGDTTAVVAEFDEALPTTKHSVPFNVAQLSVGLIVLLGGAHLLLKGSIPMAAELGISQLVVGLTVVAVGTSLPELVTSVTAALRNEPDVAFGNVIGSNVFNITVVLGAAAVIRPLEAQGLRTIDLTVLVACAVLLLPLIRSGSVLNRWEGSALLVGYVVYVYSLIQ